MLNKNRGINWSCREPETMPASSYLVIQTAVDKSLVSQNVPPGVQNYAAPSSPQPGLAGQSGRGASVVSTSRLPKQFITCIFKKVMISCLILNKGRGTSRFNRT